MHEGDFYVVKKGINHQVSAEEECSIMLIESRQQSIPEGKISHYQNNQKIKSISFLILQYRKTV
jgi:quercetin dioxygenase-like cupin family protein